MKFVVIGEPSGASMEAIMAVYPTHKTLVDEFIAQGVVIGIGPFSDRGNMAIFKTDSGNEPIHSSNHKGHFFCLRVLPPHHPVDKWTRQIWTRLLSPHSDSSHHHHRKQRQQSFHFGYPSPVEQA